MRIKHTKVSSQQDTGDASMIQPSDWNDLHSIEGIDLIMEDTEYFIRADGTGSYPTLKACFEFLNGAIVHPAKTITLTLDAGIHIQSGVVEDNVKNAQIVLVGAQPLNINITSTAAATGVADAWVVVYTLSAVPVGVIPGMFMTVHNAATDWAAGYYHFGCHEITAVAGSTVTCKVRNRTSPQTVSGVSIAATILKTVVKAGAVMGDLFATTAGGARGYWGEPYLKNICFNGDDKADNTYHIVHSTFVHCYPGVQKTYNLAFVNSINNNIVLHDRSTLFCYDGTACVSSSAQAGAAGYEQSFLNFGSWALITASRGADNFNRGLHLDFSNGIALGAFFVDNKFSAISAFGGQMRCTALRDTNWGGSGLLAYLGGSIIAA